MIKVVIIMGVLVALCIGLMFILPGNVYEAAPENGPEAGTWLIVGGACGLALATIVGILRSRATPAVDTTRRYSRQEPLKLTKMITPSVRDTRARLAQDKEFVKTTMHNGRVVDWYRDTAERIDPDKVELVDNPVMYPGENDGLLHE